MVKLLPAFLLLAGFYFNDARFIIDYYNVTNNAQANNLTFRMDSGNQRGSNFSYEIDLWNKLDVSTENGEHHQQMCQNFKFPHFP